MGRGRAERARQTHFFFFQSKVIEVHLTEDIPNALCSFGLRKTNYLRELSLLEKKYTMDAKRYVLLTSCKWNDDVLLSIDSKGLQIVN